MLINLVGGESTGKSALAVALGSQLDALVVPEVLRSFVTEYGRAPHAGEQRGVMEAQAQAERLALQTSGVVIGDPAPVMTAVYSLLYFEDDALFEAAIAHGPRADLVIWCAPDFPWQPDDGQRDGARFRTAADAIIASHVVPALDRAGMHVLHVTGPLEERLHQVRVRLDQGVAPPS